jgi:predicted nucleic acid-binding protein
MQIPVLIEPSAGNGYRARGGEPLPLVVEAPTREEALAKLKEQLQAQLRKTKIKIGRMDLRIAAVVLEHRAILVMRNLRDFRRVPGLPIED